MAFRFNPPPNWPVPPPGWTPQPGWMPLPEWPDPPPGWQLWVDDGGAARAQSAPPRSAGAKHARPKWPQTAAPQPAAATVLGAAGPPDAVLDSRIAQRGEKIGFFGGHKLAETLQQRNSELEQENERLRTQVVDLLGMSNDDRMAEADRVLEEAQARIAQARAQLNDIERQAAEAATARDTALVQVDLALGELNSARAQIVATDEVAALQEIGIYEYRHPLQDAVAYKSRLADAKDRMKAMVAGKQAVLSASSWTVNGSAQQGTSLVREVSKLMLRAYNAEADNCVRTLRPHTLQSAIVRLSKARETIARLGKTMSIQISDAYHSNRLLELELTADHLVKQEEERDRVRAERERQKEEEAARRDFERELARLQKEKAHYSTALARLHALGNEQGAAEMQQHLDQVTESMAAVERRAANIRAGYVYVISNIGSFGEDTVKIGLTRRLDPQDRIRELSDASVPFKFDVHAFIFSEDAVGLETKLHHRLEHRRVNQVNKRREFFRIKPAQVLSLLQEVAGSHLLEFHEMPEASEWRASVKAVEASTPPIPGVA